MENDNRLDLYRINFNLVSVSLAGMVRRVLKKSSWGDPATRGFALLLFVLVALAATGAQAWTFYVVRGERESRLAERDRVDMRICDNQNELRKNIRDFVGKVSTNPDTQEQVNAAFPSINCTRITEGE